MIDPERIKRGLYWQEAWSLIGGCTPVSPGCDNCWSAKETHIRASHPNEKVRARNTGLTEKGCFNGQIRLNYEFLDKPPRKKKPTVYAVWNDLFHPDVPFEFLEDVWHIMLPNKHHTYLILTKRPDKMKQFIGRYILKNHYGLKSAYDLTFKHVWLGVTAENQEQADKRIPILLQTPAAVRYVSVEPMLGPVDLTELPIPYEVDCRGFNFTALTDSDDEHYYNSHAKIDWVICGGESGPGARPCHPDWIRNPRDQCQAAGVPFFLKQMRINGKLVKMPELDGKRWMEMPGVGT